MCISIPGPRIAPWSFILAFFVAWTVRLATYGLVDSHIQDFFLKRVVSDGWRALVWLILPIFWLLFVERRGLASALHPTPVRSLRWACLTAAILIGLVVVGYRTTFGHWTGIPLDRTWEVYAAVLPGIVLVGISEEFVFRGVFFSGLLRSGWTFWPAQLVTAAAFALSHWPGWLVGSGAMGPLSLLTASIRLIVFGLVMGGLVTLEGGLALAVLVHSFNDLWVGLFF